MFCYFWSLLVLPPLISPLTLSVFDQGCAATVESWLLTNVGVVLGICLGVALVEVR